MDNYNYKKTTIKELVENLHLSVVPEEEEKLVILLLKREEEILSEMNDIYQLYENAQKNKLKLVNELSKLIENNMI